MRTLLILLPALLIGCGNDKTQVAPTEKQEDFKPIPYSLSYNYADTIARKLIPDAKWQYWAYMKFRQPLGEVNKNVFSIISEQGDLKYRKYTNVAPKDYGFFKGCHPSFCSNFVVAVKNDSVRYITTEETFRDFIGDVNNLEEAMLLAKTYGYVLGDSIISARYKIVNGNYEMNLLKAPEFAESRLHPKSEAAEVIVTPKAFVKIKSLGVYCEGRGCY
nr:hypothetical protein [uncultured Flavobacterium sp.]